MCWVGVHPSRHTRCRSRHRISWRSRRSLPQNVPLSYAVGLIGQALVAAALGSGHRRIARDLAVPAGTARGWIRGARRSAAQLRITGIRTVVAFDQDALPAQVRPDELGCALEHLGAAAMVLGRRYGLQHTSPWARVNVLTRGRLLAMAPAG